MSKAKGGGKRLYECEECHERRFVHWVEFNRASRPRCQGCGSHLLELVSDEAKRDLADLQAMRVDGVPRSMIPAAQIRANERHKVT